jgi:hypothetical protein
MFAPLFFVRLIEVFWTLCVNCFHQTSFAPSKPILKMFGHVYFFFVQHVLFFVINQNLENAYLFTTNLIKTHYTIFYVPPKGVFNATIIASNSPHLTSFAPSINVSKAFKASNFVETILIGMFDIIFNVIISRRFQYY